MDKNINRLLNGMTGLCMAVIVSCMASVAMAAESDAPTISVYTDRTIVPEGTEAPILIRADRPMIVRLELSELDDTVARLSSSSVQLSEERFFSSVVMLIVEDNGMQHTSSRTLIIRLRPEFNPPPQLEPITFTIPPDDLTAETDDPAKFIIGHNTQALMTVRVPNLQSTKSFFVSSSSDNIQITIPNGLVTTDQDSFPVTIQLREAVTPTETALDLSISHLDLISRPSAQISAGGNHSCGIKENGTMTCWGHDGSDSDAMTPSDGRVDPTSSMQDVDQNTKFLAVSAGDSHSCGIKEDGTMACWGKSNSDASGNDRIDPTGSPQDVDGNTRFLAVSAGGSHSCGIKADRTMACWGNHSRDRTNPASASPEGSVTRDTRFLAVSAGSDHSCGIKEDGTMACWGQSNRDSSGNDRIDPTSSPQGVDGDTRFLAVSARNDHSCGIREDGRAACWGKPNSDASGNDRIDPTSSPQGVDGDTRFLAVGAGSSYTCGIKIDNTAVCWGPSLTQTSPTSSVPDQGGPIKPDDKFLALSAGSSHSCGIKIDGTAACWGFPSFDFGADEPPRSFQRAKIIRDTVWLFEKEQTLEMAVAIENLSVGVYADRTVVPEGTKATILARSNYPMTIDLELTKSDDQIAIPFSASSVPLTQKQPSTLLSLFVEDNKTPNTSSRTLVLRPTARFTPPPKLEPIRFTIPPDDLSVLVKNPAAFAVGDTTQTAMVNAIPNLQAAKTFVVFSTTSRVVVSTGLLSADDKNPFSFVVELKEFGVPDKDETLDLTIIHLDAFSRPAAQISAEDFHTCGIKTDGTVQCWGRGGDGRTNPASSSQGDVSQDRFLTVDVGNEHTCGVKIDNTVACWGKRGDAGEGDRTDPTTSEQNVSTNTKFIAVSAGLDHTCGIKIDNTLACWGFNQSQRTDPTYSTAEQGGPIEPETKFLAIIASRQHGCGIKIDNTVACWESASHKRTEPTSSPQGVDKDTKFLALSAARDHTCGIKIDNTVACWGRDTNEINRTSPTSSPQGVEEDTKFLAISSEFLRNCGIVIGNTVACWGDRNSNGIDPSSSKPDQGGPVGPTTEFLAISSGDRYACGIKMDNTAACWGGGAHDQDKPPESFQQAKAKTIPDTFWLFEKSQTLEGAVVLKEPKIDAHTDRSIIPEGTTATMLIQSDQIVTVNLSLMESGDPTMVELSGSSVQLTGDPPSASIGLYVPDNKVSNTNNRAFTISMTIQPLPQTELSSLSFTVPPDNLSAEYEQAAGFAVGKAAQTIMVSVPDLEAEKTFIVSSSDTRVIVPTGFVTAQNQNPFPITVQLKEGIRLRESLDLIIGHLDSFTRDSAQFSSGDSHSCVIKTNDAIECWGLIPPGLNPPNFLFLAVSAGWEHSCGVKTDNTVTCWGDNSEGQSSPPSGKFLAVSAGGFHNCAIRIDGTMKCWGNSSAGRTDPASSMQDVDENTKFFDVDAGFAHTCAVKVNGTMACWGFDDNDRIDPTSSPQDVERNTQFLAVSAGSQHSCGIKTDGTMACWGNDGRGQVRLTSSRQNVDGNTKFLAVSTGSDHSCGIRIDGTMACWGGLEDRFIGETFIEEHSERTSPTSSPQGVEEDTRFLAVGAESTGSCGIKEDRTAACWGSFTGTRLRGGFQAQSIPDTFYLFEKEQILKDAVVPLKIELYTDRSIAPEGTEAPILIQSSQPTTVSLKLSAADSPTTARLSSSSVQLTGDPPSASIGLHVLDNDAFNPDNKTLTVSMAVYSVPQAELSSISLIVPPNDLIAEYDQAAELSIGKTVQTMMIRIPGLKAEKTFIVSSSDTRVIVPTGFITAQSQGPFPVTVQLREGALLGREDSLDLTLNYLDSFSRESAEISAGFKHTCAIKIDGTVVCWGSNDDNRSTPPRDKFLAVSAGSNHSCGVKIDGTMACWGSDNNNRSSPPSDEFLAVGAGDSHSCGIKTDGTAACWGSDANNKSSPPNDKFLAVGVGISHNCGIKTDGTMACWGSNDDNKSNPPEGKFLAVSAGDVHNCAIKINGTVECWGSNDNKVSSPPSDKFLAVSAGDKHNCGIRADSTVACWGYNGDPSRPDGRTSPTSAPGVAKDTKFLAVSAGAAHTCGIKADGTAACWGDRDDDRSSPTNSFQRAQTIPDTIRLFEKEQILENAVVPEDLSVETYTDRPIVPEGTTANILIKTNQPATVNLEVSGADTQTMTRLSVSSVQLTGDMPFASIGLYVLDNDTPHASNRTITVRLTVQSEFEVELDPLSLTVPPDDLEVSVLSPASFFYQDTMQMVTIGVTADLQSNKTFVVSSNDDHIIVPTGFVTVHDQSPVPITVRLKEGNRVRESLNLTVSHLDVFNRKSAEISAGFKHTCAVKEGNTATCWGSNADNRSSPPSDKFLAVSAGGSHSCGIKTDDTVACWGEQADGRSSPASAEGVNRNTQFLAVSAGDGHSCGIKIDGTMACWGKQATNRTDPTSVEGVNRNTKFLAVSAGADHTCAIKIDGTIACWGNQSSNRADLGSSQQDIDRNTKFLAVSSGSTHTCAIKEDGTMACWGSDFSGESDPPSDKFLAVGTGDSHTCGIKIDGTMACWGEQADGQSSPTSAIGVAEDTQFLAVSAGGFHTCGIRTDGTAACWGMRDDGQSSPTESFQRAQTIPDTIRMFEKEQTLENAVRRAAEIDVLHPTITIGEGKTAQFTLFRATEALMTTVTITMMAANNDSVMISSDAMGPSEFKPSAEVKVKLSMRERIGKVTITAIDDESYLIPDPVFFTLLVDDGKVPLVPVSEVKITIESDEFHIVGFSSNTLVLEEGNTGVEELSITTESTRTVTATVESPNAEQLKLIDKEGVSKDSLEIAFSEDTKTHLITFSAELDKVIEPQRSYPISVTLNEAFQVSTSLTVVVLAQSAPLMTMPAMLRLKENESAELGLSINGTLAEPAMIALTAQGGITINGSSMHGATLSGQDAEDTVIVAALFDKVIQSATRSDAISLNTRAETVTLPMRAIPVIVENNEFHTIAFTPNPLRVKDSETGTVTLGIDPPLDSSEYQSDINSVEVMLQSSGTVRATVMPNTASFAADGSSTARVTVGAMVEEDKAFVSITISRTEPAGLHELIKIGEALTIEMDAIRLRIKVYLEGAL